MVRCVVFAFQNIYNWGVRFTAGFDGGDTALVGFQSKLAGYYISLPNFRYKEAFDKFYQKIKTTKYILDYLIKYEWDDPSYNQLLQYLYTAHYISEEYVLENAHFICKQVMLHLIFFNKLFKPYLCLD